MGKRPDLIRTLGPWASTAVVVGTVIGTGIFLKPSEMAREGGSVAVVFAAWIAGALLSLFGAISFAELGAAIPEAGGEYAYLTRGFGPCWGFLFGWSHSIVSRPASAASVAAGLTKFLSFLIPAVTQRIFDLHFHIPVVGKSYTFAFTWAQPLAVAAVGVITYVNYLGVRIGGRLQLVLTVTKVSAVLAIVACGLTFSHGKAENFQPAFPTVWGFGLFGAFWASLAASLWAYDGWEDLNLLGSEVQDPQRNIPRALIRGVVFVAIVYLVFNFVCFYVLPFHSVANSNHLASDVIDRSAGPNVARWMTIAMAISALGTLNASIMSGARVPYAMARDGVFFHLVGGVHPRFRTPARALIFQGILTSIMALTGTFEELTDLFIFAGWIFYGLAVVALLRMRRTEPNLPRPYRTWGYPWVPLIFVFGAAALTVNLWLARPVRSSIGLFAILLGLPFYRYWVRHAAPHH